MRIAMIMSTPFPPEEGIGFYVYNLSKKLIESGHKVTVITRGRFKQEKFIFQGIKVIKLPFLPIYPFHISFHGFFLNKFLDKNNDTFDILNIHTPLTPVPTIDLPVISTVHGSLIGNAREIQVVDFRSLGNKILTRLVSYPLLSKLLKKSDIVATVSEQVRNEIREFYDYSDVEVVYNGVESGKFFPGPLKESYILYVGRLSYGKGLFELIKASEKLEDKTISVLLVGEGELKAKINDFIKKRGLEEKIILKGHIHSNELVKIYQRALLFVFPSHYEGFPTVVLEAMSSGLPVLLSDIPAHNDIIEDGIDGILFKKGNFLDMAEKLNNLINNKDLRETLAQKARQKVLEKYTWNKISSKYINLFNIIMGEKG